jgi:FO synthase
VKAAEPAMHIHAFSPLEIAHGAETLSLPVPEFLGMLKAAGLGSLPGTAAEILHDDVRAIICPDKLTTAQWLGIVEAAHHVGIRTTATIMFGHVDGPDHWAAHLLAIRDLQERTGGFTEFVPLPFIPMEAPLFLKGQTRKGPTLRETVLMHAVARLAFGALIPNIQTSWVKLGEAGSQMCLNAGANDLGGTLMNLSFSRGAGRLQGLEKPPHALRALICAMGGVPGKRTTLYQDVPDHIAAAAEAAVELLPTVQTPPADPGALAHLSIESTC